jgi:hypothetical protein
MGKAVLTAITVLILLASDAAIQCAQADESGVRRGKAVHLAKVVREARWQRVCSDRYACYSLYGAYGPYGGAGYWTRYTYDGWGRW